MGFWKQLGELGDVGMMFGMSLCRFDYIFLDAF